MEISRCFVFCVSIYVGLFSLCTGGEVPVILWNIKGSALHLQPVSAFEDGSRNSALEIFEEVLNHDSSGLVVFLLDKLSMEDLALQSYQEDSNNTIKVLETFLDQHPFVMHPNVKDPSLYLQKTSCGVDDIYVTPSMAGRLHKAIPAVLKHSCVVFVHLPYSTGLSDDKLLFNADVFLPKFHNRFENVVGVFTSKKSSWEPTENVNHKTRGLLAVDETITDVHFINASGCMFMFAENASVSIGDNETTWLQFPPVVELSACEELCNCSGMKLTFSQEGDIKTAVFNFLFERLPTAWKMSRVTTELTGLNVPKGEIFMRGSFEAPYSFSYSCGDLYMESEKDNASSPVGITFTGFQIQPVDVTDQFGHSFDCVQWFTIPIWMGSFIVLFFVTILNVGVYFLFQAKTMDRFDDPKGKTISVPQTE